MITEDWLNELLYGNGKYFDNDLERSKYIKEQKELYAFTKNELKYFRKKEENKKGWLSFIKPKKLDGALSIHNEPLEGALSINDN